jgi:hypothetical protein
MEFLICACIGGSLLTIEEVTIQRYVKICFPFAYERWMQKKVLVIAVILESISIAVILSVAAWYATDENYEATCSLHSIIQNSKIVRIYSAVDTAAILLTSTFLYLHLAWIARKHRLRIQMAELAPQRTTATGKVTHIGTTGTVLNTNERKRTSMVGIILTVQYLSLLPFIFRQQFEKLGDGSNWSKLASHVLLELCDTIMYSSSFVSPLVYSLRCTEIRTEVKKMLSFKYRIPIINRKQNLNEVECI